MVFCLGISDSDFECTILGSCNIAIVVQPYGYEKRLKPEFTYTWSNIANQVLRLKTCLEPPRTVADRKPQGGYKPLVSEFSLNRYLDPMLIVSSYPEPASRHLHVYYKLEVQLRGDDGVYGYWESDNPT